MTYSRMVAFTYSWAHGGRALAPLPHLHIMGAMAAYILHIHGGACAPLPPLLATFIYLPFFQYVLLVGHMVVGTLYNYTVQVAKYKNK